MRAKPPRPKGDANGFSPEAIWAAGLFAILCICLQAWRSEVLQSSYDQGIFQQVLWSTLHGHPFESTLSSQLSTNVIHNGELPSVGYQRLGQHFTPALLLWVPLFGMLGGAALPIIQVGLITLSGLILNKISRDMLPERTSNWITYGYFFSTALIGPTLGNFTDLSQLPIAFFLLVFGLQKRKPWLIISTTIFIPLIREDTGVLLVGIGAWLILRYRNHWRIAIAISLYGILWMLLTTSVLMPIFSDDNSKRFMVENFGQYLQPSQGEGVSSIVMLRQIVTSPILILKELFDPPLQTLLYLLAHALPFLFIPLICLDTWILAGPSLLGLFLAQGSNDPLSITIRYTLLVVPGFSIGTILWWSNQRMKSPSKRMRNAWRICLALALILTLSSNPNRSLSFLIPDSSEPWVYSSPIEQWKHGKAARKVLELIPAKASVSATTHLVPLLAQREVVVRYPNSSAYVARDGTTQPVEWIAVDLDWLKRYSTAFPRDWRKLKNIQKKLVGKVGQYQTQAIHDGVVVLQLNGPEKPELNAFLQDLLRASLPSDPKLQKEP